MKILAVGDVVGGRAVEYLESNLWKVREENKIAFTVVNGENASEIHGIGATDAKTLISSGADLITLGNHTYGRRDICEFLSESESIIRPANYPPMAPGGGYTLLNINGWRILGINIFGNFYEPAIMFILPPGAFIVLGTILGILSVLKSRKKEGNK